jgi:plastocyanin
MTRGIELPTVVDLTPDRLTAISESRRRASVLRGGVVSPKLTRLLAVTAVAAGLGIVPMPGASAVDRAVVVYDMPTGFQQDVNASGQCHSTSDFKQMPFTDVDPGDSVNWFMNGQNQQKHNITPANDVPGGQHWPGGAQKSDDLAAGADAFVVSFTKAAPGYYFYYSSANEEGTDKKGVLDGMCGVIHVRGAATPPPPPATDGTTTSTTQAPTSTDTTAPPATTGTTAPATAIPSATHPATPAAPAPTTTATSKPEKDHKGKDDTTTTTTAPPANGPVDLPAEAIVPNLTPGASATQDGVVQPSSTPQGDAIALIKHKHGHGPVLLLIASGLGIGGLGIGTGVYKYANRSSKYFPA